MKLNEQAANIMNTFKYLPLLPDHEQQIELRKVLKFVNDLQKNNFNQMYGPKYRKITYGIIQQLKLSGLT